MSQAASVVLPGVPVSFVERLPEKKATFKSFFALLTKHPHSVQHIAISIVKQPDFPEELIAGDWLPARVMVPPGYGSRMVEREQHGRGMPPLFRWQPYREPYCTHGLLPDVMVQEQPTVNSDYIAVESPYRLAFADDGARLLLLDRYDRRRAEVVFEQGIPQLLVVPRFTLSVRIDTEYRLIQTQTFDHELGELFALQEVFEPELPLTIRAIREAAHAVRLLEKHFPDWRDVCAYWRGTEVLQKHKRAVKQPVPPFLATAQ